MPAYSADMVENASEAAEATDRMNQMYRWQRHIYNATRRYYLLGRDRMIGELRPAPGANVLEIGCGTGRNLMQAARRYPDAQFFGIDISTEMLKSATHAIAAKGMAHQIHLAHGDGASFDPSPLFGTPVFDHVTISYSLSMIPDWQRVLHCAMSHIKPGGQLHIVDFGGQERLPRPFRRLLLRWLTMFDVTPRNDLEPVLSGMAEASASKLHFERPFRGYAQYAVMTLSAARSMP